MPSTNSLRPARKRQIGAEKSTTPLPIVPPRPSERAIIWARLAIIITIVLWVVYVVTTVVREFLDRAPSYRFTMEAISYVVVVTFLMFSALMYLLARYGALMRFRSHVRVPRAEIDHHFGQSLSDITVLIPSYAEEPNVVRETLWSAALQEYPSMRVVLLVDDPPYPTDPAIAARLAETRALPQKIMDDLAEPRTRFTDTLMQYQIASLEGEHPTLIEVRSLAHEYRWAHDWLEQMAADEVIDDHVDVFFTDQVLRALAAEFAVIGDALMAAADAGEPPTQARMLELYRRLSWTFNAELAVFERKAYASLSHEANKAMNLNSYIGLMGGAYREEQTPAGVVLRRTAHEREADLVIPDTTYLLTLDADSILLREYCLRLVYLLEQPGNERVAVTQTPYSAFRGAGTRIERLSGATTDLQHILHQGMSYFGAAFWVGANAVIRKRALADIEEKEMVGGFEIKRYVQDRTVIEDTESSIDLGTHGWRIVSYPERMSYSATPPDFGSLVVQRRRWANGGLLILPKFFRQLRDRRAHGERVRAAEVMLRMNYMASIAWGSLGLIFLLAYPYDSRLLSVAVLAGALPYFISMGLDLRSAGYRFVDIFSIYGFNLVLLPVNLAGVIKSIEQAITAKKIPFSRTPKIKDRTATPLLYVVAPVAIVVFSVVTVVRDLAVHDWGNLAFAALNTVLGLFAFLAYIGLGHAIVDVWRGAIGWLFVPARPKAPPAPTAADPAIDWKAVLYDGAHDATIDRRLEDRREKERA